MNFEEKLELARKFNKQIVAGNKVNKISADKMIKQGDLQGDDLAELVDIYPDYAVGKAYKVGDIFKLDNLLYKVIQPHTSQADWIPKELPALYLELMPSNVIPDFVQPTGAHDAYQKDDMVMFNGKKYRSKVDANAYSPTAYAQNWEEIV